MGVDAEVTHARHVQTEFPLMVNALRVIQGVMVLVARRVPAPAGHAVMPPTREDVSVLPKIATTWLAHGMDLHVRRAPLGIRFKTGGVPVAAAQVYLLRKAADGEVVLMELEAVARRVAAMCHMRRIQVAHQDTYHHREMRIRVVVARPRRRHICTTLVQEVLTVLTAS